MMDNELEFKAAGRKGEEAIDVDISGMLPGDWCTVILAYSAGDATGKPITLKIVNVSAGEYRLVGEPDYYAAAADETHIELGVNGLASGTLRLRRKRDPKADAAKAAGGDFTA